MGKKGYISVLLFVLFIFLSNVFNNVSAFNIPDEVINSVVFVMQEVEKDNKQEDIPVDYLVDILFSDELKQARENAENSIYGIK